MGISGTKEEKLPVKICTKYGRRMNELESLLETLCESYDKRVIYQLRTIMSEYYDREKKIEKIYVILDFVKIKGNKVIFGIEYTKYDNKVMKLNNRIGIGVSYNTYNSSQHIEYSHGEGKRKSDNVLVSNFHLMIDMNFYDFKTVHDRNKRQITCCFDKKIYTQYKGIYAVIIG